MALLFEVVPAVIRAVDTVTNLKIRGEGFSVDQPRTLRFVSPDSVVVVPITGFAITSDILLTVASIEFPVTGTYRLQLENNAGLIVALDGAVVVNRPPVSFTLNKTSVVVNQVVEGLQLTLTGVASAQVGMVRFSGDDGLFELDEYTTPDPKTIAFPPLLFGFLGAYDVQLFEDATGTTPIGEALVGYFEVGRSPVAPTITGLSMKNIQPDTTTPGVFIQGTGFADAGIEVVRLESITQSFSFTPQPPPFVPEEDVPAGQFRVVSDTAIALGPIPPARTNEFGVYLEGLDGGNPIFLASRSRALSVLDTRKPAVVFLTPPGEYEQDLMVGLQAQTTDPVTGLPTGIVDPTASIYYTIHPLDDVATYGELSLIEQSLIGFDIFPNRVLDRSTSQPAEWRPVNRPTIGPSTRLTGALQVRVDRSMFIKAVAVDSAGNISSLLRGTFFIKNPDDRALVALEDLTDSYVRFANVNSVIRDLRIRYKGILDEDTVPGVDLVAPGSTIGQSALLRDVRRALVDILNGAGQSLVQVLPIPSVQYMSELKLKLTPGREIFASSPFPHAPGNDNWRVTRRTSEFGFDEAPADDDYEVLLIPSYAGHSYLDPYIRPAGSSTMPDDMVAANQSVVPVTIFRKIATFTVTGGKIDSSTIVNITAGRTAVSRFTDRDLESTSLIPAKDIHWREIEIALANITLPPGLLQSTGDSGTRVSDQKVLPSLADETTTPPEFMPLSNTTDEPRPDEEVVLAAAVGDTPKGPASTNLTNTIKVVGAGIDLYEGVQTITARIPPTYTFMEDLGFQGYNNPYPVLRLDWDLFKGEVTVRKIGGKDGVLMRHYGTDRRTVLAEYSDGDTFPATPIPETVSIWGKFTNKYEQVPVSAIGTNFRIQGTVVPEGGDGASKTVRASEDSKVSFDFLTPAWGQDQISFFRSFSRWPAPLYTYGYGQIVVRLHQEKEIAPVYPATITYDPAVEGVDQYFDVQVSKIDKDGKFKLDSTDANPNLVFQMFNFKENRWLTSDESKEFWDQAAVLYTVPADPNAPIVATVPTAPTGPVQPAPGTGTTAGPIVRIRVSPIQDAVVGDVDNVNFTIYLNGKLAKGPF